MDICVLTLKKNEAHDFHISLQHLYSLSCNYLCTWQNKERSQKPPPPPYSITVLPDKSSNCIFLMGPSPWQQPLWIYCCVTVFLNQNTVNSLDILQDAVDAMLSTSQRQQRQMGDVRKPQGNGAYISVSRQQWGTCAPYCCHCSLSQSASAYERTTSHPVSELLIELRGLTVFQRMFHWQPLA